jgi:chromate transporter
MVVQFVAFLGAYRDPAGWTPWLAGVLASLLVTWVTFVPSFPVILLGAPVRGAPARQPHPAGPALTGITAAVVGVIANLAVYFSLHTLFGDTTRLTAVRSTCELPPATCGGLRWPSRSWRAC